jgi:Mrp family chromosome partitioning ATPase
MKANGNGNGNGNGFNPRLWSAPWQRRGQTEQDAAAYRRLALQLHYDLSHTAGPRSVLLVTPSTSALCARGSVAVASCLAEQSCRRVLLIDVCPENPEASRILQGYGTRGFTDFLGDSKPQLGDLVLPTTCENVSFLPAGADIEHSDPAAPENIKAFLHTAETKYDYVLLCGGSVLHDPTTFALAPYVGRVLLLVIENQTRMEDLDAAQDVLALCKAPKVGLVFAKPTRNELRPT